MAGCLHQQPGESALPASPVRSCRPGGAVGQATAHTPHQSGEECVLKSKRREEKRREDVPMEFDRSLPIDRPAAEVEQSRHDVKPLFAAW